MTAMRHLSRWSLGGMRSPRQPADRPLGGQPAACRFGVVRRVAVGPGGGAEVRGHRVRALLGEFHGAVEGRPRPPVAAGPGEALHGRGQRVVRLRHPDTLDGIQAGNRHRQGGGIGGAHLLAGRHHEPTSRVAAVVAGGEAGPPASRAPPPRHRRGCS